MDFVDKVLGEQVHMGLLVGGFNKQKNSRMPMASFKFLAVVKSAATRQTSIRLRYCNVLEEDIVCFSLGVFFL